MPLCARLRVAHGLAPSGAASGRVRRADRLQADQDAPHRYRGSAVADFDSLYDLCREYLDAASAAISLTVGGPIGRTYIAAGPPAFDCEQVTVYAGGPAEATTEPLNPPLVPGYRVDVTGRVNLIAMTCTILRCSPSPDNRGNPPAVAALDAAARASLGDVWAVWNHIATLRLAGQLWMPKTRAVFYDPAQMVNTSGGISGWQIPLRVELEGFRTQ